MRTLKEVKDKIQRGDNTSLIEELVRRREAIQKTVNNIIDPYAFRFQQGLLRAHDEILQLLSD